MKWLLVYAVLSLAPAALANETEYLPHAGATVDYNENSVTFDNGETKTFESYRNKTFISIGESAVIFGIGVGIGFAITGVLHLISKRNED